MEVNITKFDHFGRGIGKINNKVVFVNRALPGEIVDFEITKEKKNYYEGKINKIIKESNMRKKSICPFYDECGGCDFLHTNSVAEKEFKINKAIELLGKVDNYYDTSKMNYRNKVTLHIQDNKVGLYKENTQEIIEIDYCYLLDDNINRVIKDLKKIDLSNYLIKKIVIKSNLGKVLLDIDSDVDDNFLKIFDYVDTIICQNKIIKGIGYLEERIDNKIFKITSKAFFQVNKEGLEHISRIINDYLKDKNINNALDLYSGTSLWGILISDSVKRISSVEVNSEACKNAQDNILKNKITNIQVINGKVEDYINEFNNIDLVIVDPPRSGLDKKTREYLKKISSQYIIYISCDMLTLKRDLDDLKIKYDVKCINLINMFKMTYHCESICLLERK